MVQKQIITDNAELTLSVMPLPADTNPKGDVFGGWLLSQLDIAGAVPARRIAIKTNEAVVTKAVNHVNFIAPIAVGDKVDFYAQVHHIGKTSIVVHMHVNAERYHNGEIVRVAEAEFAYVRIGRS